MRKGTTLKWFQFSSLGNKTHGYNGKLVHWDKNHGFPYGLIPSAITYREQFYDRGIKAYRNETDAARESEKKAQQAALNKGRMINLALKLEEGATIDGVGDHHYEIAHPVPAEPAATHQGKVSAAEHTGSSFSSPAAAPVRPKPRPTQAAQAMKTLNLEDQLVTAGAEGSTQDNQPTHARI